jgi:hypothetical protein
VLPLADVAYLADCPPKWVLNTCAALQLGTTYSLELARTLQLTHRLHDTLAMPLTQAYEIALTLQDEPRCGDRALVTIPLTYLGDISVKVDVARLDAAFAARRAALMTTVEPRVRGRPSSPSDDPIAAAEAWGLDLSLLSANLRRTPSERLRQLDAMMAFRRSVRRPTARAGA